MGSNYAHKETSRRGISRVLCLMVGLSLPMLIGAGVTPLQAAETNTTAQAPGPKQTKKIVGVVSDSKTGEPIIGAAVRLKGSSQGVITDIEGHFEIQAAPGDQLFVSSVGYTSKTIRVEKTTILSITLSEDAKTLQNVVVTAFGTGQKKESVTGSIQTVRPMELKIPSANLSNAFAGRLAGVIAYQRSGEPGSNGSDFFIRGVASMNSQAPLIVLDGVEISRADLNALDPEVIESFSVLKDATASAMYGTRGANGVLIIKTKSGADLDRPVIGVRIENYINMPVQLPKLANAETYMRLYNEAVTNQGTGSLLYSEDRIRKTLSGEDRYLYPNVDWYKELFNDVTYNQRANFNVRGGTSKITYFLNANVNHETGMLKGRSKDFFSYDNNISLMKYAFQNNVDFHLSPSATIAMQLNAQLSNFHGPVTASNGNGSASDIYKGIMDINPVDFPVMWPQNDSQWVRWGGYRLGSNNAWNPVADASSGYKDTFESTVIANLNYTQKLDFITKGLSFKGLASFKNWSTSTTFRHQGYNIYQNKSDNKLPDGDYDLKMANGGDPSRPVLGTGGNSAGDRRFYLQAFLNYDRTFGKHNVAGMLLYNQDEHVVNNPNNDLIRSLPHRRQGYAARVNYEYDGRYMVEVNAGISGSENFAKGHRYGFFPSFSAGWNISNEGFWQPLKKAVNNLKLRASYGLAGNDQAGERFVYLDVVDNSSNDRPYFQTGFDGQTEGRRGPLFKRFLNEDITWEIARKLNVGFDISVLRMLNLTVDFFQEHRTNVFQEKQSIPNYFGTAASKIYGNFAEVKNWGVDMSAELNKQLSKDLTMQLRGTFTFARNRVVKYDEAPNLRPTRRQVGRSLFTYTGYVADGYYIDQADIAHSPKSTLNNIAVAPGDIKYLDQPDEHGKYDGIIDENDQVPLGYSTVPEINYGLGGTFTYKQWDFGFHLQGQAHTSLMMSGFSPFGTNTRRNVLQWIADNHWSKDNQNPHALYPRLTEYDNNQNTKNSTHWLRDASFLKLRSLEIGYRFKMARVYVNANNLLTLSSFKLWDPEMGGGKGMSYPLQRTFNLGVNFTFK